MNENERDELLIQTHFALVWWAASLTSRFFQSDSFKKMKFESDYIHRRLQCPGEAEKSLIVPSLYVALVIPREIIFDQYEDDFKKIDELIASKATLHKSPCQDKTQIQFTRRLRNAVAHARISIKDGAIEFEDCSRNKSDYLKATIDFLTVGQVVHQLQLILLKHVKKLQEETSKTPTPRQPDKSGPCQAE